MSYSPKPSFGDARRMAYYAKANFPEAYESFKRQYKENKARRQEEQSKSSLDQKLREAGL